jgi:pimeloyl-ACP methyl ester carboxylesterase
VQDIAVSRRQAPASLIYLHGFASSPESTKARFFADRLRESGRSLIVPDFNEPDFTTLTVSRMLRQLADALDAAERPAALIGSSLGGAVAVLAAARLPSAVDRLILLAPAVMLARPGHSLLPPERILEWAREGSRPFLHYGYGEERMLDYAFYADSLLHDAFDASFQQPALIFQGRNDTVVDYQSVERFARARSNVTLCLLEDDHQLTASLSAIWSAAGEFLGLDL